MSGDEFGDALVRAGWLLVVLGVVLGVVVGAIAAVAIGASS